MLTNNLSLRTSTLLYGLLLVGTGCATTSAPRGWLPSLGEVQEQAYGGWIEIDTQRGPQSIFRGELIAVDTDTVYVLAAHMPHLSAVAIRDVREARMFRYSSGSGLLGGWTLLGILSTASHGVNLALSAPVWILVGTAAAVAQSHTPVLKYQGHSWEAFGAFSRFPQGLPPALARRDVAVVSKR